MAEPLDDDRQKKERSPSAPFISLRKAIERAEQFQTAHKRDSARLGAIAVTWGYGSKSSGLLQTAAALKQYGLLDESGSGDERRFKISDLARKIMSDARPGARESGLTEAVKKPKLFAEYIDRWVPEMPTEAHCVSELVHDRGFTEDAARAFIKNFKISVSFAGLMARDRMSFASGQSERETDETEGAAPAARPSVFDDAVATIQPPAETSAALPFRRRYQVTVADDKISVTATLVSAAEVDILIRILEANKALLDAFDDPAVN